VEANVSKVNSIHQSQYAQSSTVVYPYRVQNRFFLYVADNLETRHIEVPQSCFITFWERLWQNLGGNVSVDLAQRLNAQAEGLVDFASREGIGASSDTILVLDGDVINVNFQRVFPNKVVVRSVSLNEEMITNHLAGLYTSPSLTPENTAIINGVPNNPSELGQIGLENSDWGQWDGIYQTWNDAAGKNGFSVSGNTAQDALSAFETSSNIVIVVAHSDGYSIFFPDGSSLSVDDISNIRDNLRENEPLVLLFSCETAKVDEGLASFAEGLVNLGAKAVVAPVSTIGARSSSLLLENFLKASIEGLSPVEALRRAIQETNNPSLETWVGMLPKASGR
jgi:hypothetical protein